MIPRSTSKVRRLAVALLHWLQQWVGETLVEWEGPTQITPEIETAFRGVAPILVEVRRHMHNVKAAHFRKSTTELRQHVLDILKQQGVPTRTAAFAIELVLQQWPETR